MVGDEKVKAHAPCTRLKPGTNSRCGLAAIGVVHLTRGNEEYFAYVCAEHYQKAGN